MKRMIAVFLFLTATMFAQQQTQVVNPDTATSRTGMEQKGYDDAMREVEAKKQKAEADKVKAEQEAEAKKRSSLVMYSAVDKATQELTQSAKKPLVKEAKKLLLKRQQLIAELQKVDQRLQQLDQQVVSVEKAKNVN